MVRSVRASSAMLGVLARQIRHRRIAGFLQGQGPGGVGYDDVADRDPDALWIGLIGRDREVSWFWASFLVSRM
jgi:hypothetical protein